MMPVPVTRTSARFMPDPGRVIANAFAPGGDLSVDGRTRIQRILGRILGLTDAEVGDALRTTRERFGDRHRDLARTLEANFGKVAHHLENPSGLSGDRRALIGAYFTSEYALESAALSNPSMVQAPDQSGLEPGETRFVLSLRAIGEGHISSIQFRSGIVGAEGDIRVEPSTRFVGTASRKSPVYDKPLFRAKLMELRAYNEIAASVLDSLPSRFTLIELEEIIGRVSARLGPSPDTAHATHTIHWLASSNYVSTFEPDSSMSERVLFPAGPTESHGMEDARFVRFTYDDGTITYLAPYTAFDGYQILPQLIETPDFVTFGIATLNGACAKNKGIAFFPRKLDGDYVALSRIDNENNHLMRSDNFHFWHRSETIQTPRRSWELTQLGNCGSPLETEAGFLVITHGVGPMRQYALGAILLDPKDPARVIGHLSEPLLEPTADERDGYVPNVVYSCGSMISGELLVLPYGFSDIGTRIATIRLEDLLTALKPRA